MNAAPAPRRIDLAEDERFSPRPNRRLYLCLLVNLGALLVFASYLVSHTMLESQLSLGMDPGEVAGFVSLSLAGGALAFRVPILSLRRELLAKGELRFDGSLVTLSRDGAVTTFDTSDVLRLTCDPGGANVRIRWSAGGVRLPGQWLPLLWTRGWKGWGAPDGSRVHLNRKTHPLLLAFLTRRPDLKPRISATLPFRVLSLLLLPLLPEVAMLPTVLEARRATTRQRTTEEIRRTFESGRYADACAAYRQAIPILKYEVYATQDASLALLYCGDPKSAVKTFVGYEITPFWPIAADPGFLARIRISRHRYAQAEAILRPGPSYLLYLALAERGRRAEAETVLERMKKGGISEALLLLHQGRADEARTRALALHARLQRTSYSPLCLGPQLEASLLARGAARTVKEEPAAGALKALPGLREEIVRFVDREIPKESQELRAALSAL